MKRYLYISFWLGILAVIAGVLLFYEGDLLWKLQELNLFLSTKLFFQQQLVVPGGLLTWVSTFFQQFLAWPLAGVLLLCGWWLLLMWLTKRTFRLPPFWASLALIPVGLLLLTVTDMGYWIYVLKLRGHVFAATIGTTTAVSLLWLFRLLPQRFLLQPAFIVAATLVGYPLIGIYGLAAALLMAAWSWQQRQSAAANTIAALLSVAATPLLYYHLVYYQTSLANIYFAGLPLYTVDQEYHAYYLPYYLLALFYMAMAAASDRLAAPTRLVRPLAAQAAVLAAIVAGVAYFWVKDENFHRELAMLHCIDRQDWEGVVGEAWQQEDEPTRAIVMMRNLALSRLGRQNTEMYNFKNGSKKYAAPFGMRTMLCVGPLAYYHYGILNYCTRLCMEMGVEFGWRAEYLKLMAKCALLNGEQAQTRKYLGVLSHSLTFSDWARQTRPLVGDSAAIANHTEYGPVTHMLHYADELSSDNGFVERFIMNQLAGSTYRGDPVFQEQTLLASLWTRSSRQFWYHFYDYIYLHPDDDVPIYYQQAAYLHGKQDKRGNLDALPFRRSVIEGYNRFNQEAPKFNDADIEVARQGLYPIFGQTYYYEYFLMNHLPEY